MEPIEFPKWIYHPETGEGVIVDSPDAEEKQMGDWGYDPIDETDPPLLDLSNKPEDLNEKATDQPETDGLGPEPEKVQNLLVPGEDPLQTEDVNIPGSDEAKDKLDGGVAPATETKDADAPKVVDETAVK